MMKIWMTDPQTQALRKMAKIWTTDPWRKRRRRIRWRTKRDDRRERRQTRPPLEAVTPICPSEVGAASSAPGRDANSRAGTSDGVGKSATSSADARMGLQLVTRKEKIN
jgi:hypothetical protein